MLQQPNQNKPSTNTAESALATYGIVLALILTTAALFVGFNKTNMFIALAFIPMIGYFLYEFGGRIFPKNDEVSEPLRPKLSSLSAFLLQDSALLRVSLSLLIVALVAIMAKAQINPSEIKAQVNADIVSPLPE